MDIVSLLYGWPRSVTGDLGRTGIRGANPPVLPQQWRLHTRGEGGVPRVRGSWGTSAEYTLANGEKFGIWGGPPSSADGFAAYPDDEAECRHRLVA